MKNPIDIYRLVKPYEGQTIKTYRGEPNRIIEVDNDSVLVATARSPKGASVSMMKIRRALESLIENGEIDIHHMPPPGYRGSFVVGLLLTLQGVVKDQM